jgi:hypothetical protein
MHARVSPQCALDSTFKCRLCNERFFREVSHTRQMKDGFTEEVYGKHSNSDTREAAM